MLNLFQSPFDTRVWYVRFVSEGEVEHSFVHLRIHNNTFILDALTIYFLPFSRQIKINKMWLKYFCYLIHDLIVLVQENR